MMYHIFTKALWIDVELMVYLNDVMIDFQYKFGITFRMPYNDAIGF